MYNLPKIGINTMDNYIDNSELDSARQTGSYKLSKKIIKRLLPATLDIISYDRGRKIITKMPNVTDSELLILIYLTHISDSTGLVHALHYSEIIQATGLTSKTYYNALNGLSSKRYIKLRKVSHGRYDVTICDNDFSGSKHKNYVNTNNDIYIPGTLQYARFRALPLNAKKTLLYIAANYNINRGFRFCTHTLAKHLNVQKIRIHRYLSKCVPLLGNYYIRRITRSGVVVCVHPKIYVLRANSSIYDTQMTYQKRQFARYIDDNKINVYYQNHGHILSTKEQLHLYLNALYNILHANAPKIGRYKALRLIYQYLSYYNSLDPWRIKLIRTAVHNFAKSTEQHIIA